MASFEMKKIACASCGSTTVKVEYGFLTCDFCSSQYYIDELKHKRVPIWWEGEEYNYSDDIPSSPYWVDGGVSFRYAKAHVKWLD